MTAFLEVNLPYSVTCLSASVTPTLPKGREGQGTHICGYVKRNKGWG
jgi:hypothetical protein